MISLEAPSEELVTRLLLRAKTSGRTDDTLEVIKVRLKEYDDKTKPVADFYAKKNKYFPVNGVGDIDDIFNNIVETMESNLKKEFTNIVILGKPGSGKGTQGKFLADKHNLVYISTGALMRQEILDDTEIGRIAKPYMDKGEIVPDEIPIRLIERVIEDNRDANGFIFKGFPRTMVQAYILDGLLQREDMHLTGMIEMKLTTLKAVKRLSARAHTDRARPYDMSTDLIVNRLEQYREKTLPVNEYYRKQGKFNSIKAVGPEEDVFNRLSEKIEEISRTNL